MSSSIFVCGVHRSGTSALAGVLHRLGVFMGQDEWEPQKYNKKGNYGDSEIHNLLEQAYGNWRDPNLQMPPQIVKQRMGEIIRAREAEHDLWGSKSSYYPLCIGVFARMAEHPCVLFTTRDFEESAMSLARRSDGRLPLRICKDIISDYWRKNHVARLTINNKVDAGFGVVSFDDLIGNPESVVEMLTDMLTEFVGYTPSVEKQHEAAAFIDPDLRHFGG